jgi:methylenetetrahydrofolate reductase (NADPH)
VPKSIIPEPVETNPGREIHGFEQACRSDNLVVTVEVAPPDSADPEVLIKRASHFTGLVDAINITDGAGANCHMSSAAGAAILAVRGLIPVLQISCRDRNRIAVQGDLLGAAALGVRNVLCLTGDDVSQGDHPQAKPVFDLDSVSLLQIARNMRDRGAFLSGRKLDVAPNLFLGATANPFMPPFRDRIANLEAKIDAGAQFIQTQFCFDVAMFADFMREVRARELHRRATIIVGVGTLSSTKALRRMAERVPGIHIPDDLIQRIARAEDQRAEGKRILVETINALTEIEGVGGVHLMGYRNEGVLADAIVEAGLRPKGEQVPMRA